MLLLASENDDTFLTLYFQLAFRVGWNSLLAFLVVAGADLRTDGERDAFRVQHMELEATDITEEYLQADGDAFRCPSLAKGRRAVAINGISRELGIPIRLIMTNQVDRLTVITPMIPALKDDPHILDPYLDSLEILTHRHHTRHALQNRQG